MPTFPSVPTRYPHITLTFIFFFPAFFFPNGAFANPTQTFQFAVIGDMPYDPIDVKRLDNLINALNQQNPDFVIHVGDIKGGGTPCSNELLSKRRNQILKINPPVHYTPGDNEWTDCHRSSSGSFDPFERLNFLRTLFFPNPQQGVASLPSPERQLPSHPENTLFHHHNITFSLIHVVGSNNGLNIPSPLALDQFQLRNNAAILWLKHSFLAAQNHNSDALVIAFHANIFLNPFGLPLFGGFSKFLDEIKHHAQNLHIPILLVHGDHHQFIVDQPLRSGKNRNFDNITRLQTFGDEDIHAVIVSVNPHKPAVFSFEQLPAPGARSFINK